MATAAVVELSIDIKAFPSSQFVGRLLLSKNYKMVDLQLQRRKVGYNINASFTFISKAVKIDLFISGQFRAILKVALKTTGILVFLGRYKKK